MRVSTTDKFKAQGFDKTKYDRSAKKWWVRCSQCEALSINGVPTHEIGCPNWKLKR